MAWKVAFYSPSLEKDLMDLPAGFLARFLRYAERMEVHGPDLGMPHTRSMGKGLFELRLKSAEGIARVLVPELNESETAALLASASTIRKAIDGLAIS